MISDKSEVDETLFGQPTKSTRGRPRSGEAAAYVSKEMMASLNDCTVIGSAELERLKVLPHTPDQYVVSCADLDGYRKHRL